MKDDFLHHLLISLNEAKIENRSEQHTMGVPVAFAGTVHLGSCCSPLSP